MKRLLPLFLILLTLVAVSCDNSTPKKTEPEKEVPTYTVTFDLDGGTAAGFSKEQKVKEGSKVSQPTVEPKKDGTVAFMEWRDADGIEYNFDTPVTKDITLKAHYWMTMDATTKSYAYYCALICSMLYNQPDLDRIPEENLAQLAVLFTKESRIDTENDLLYLEFEGVKYYFPSEDAPQDAKFVYVDNIKVNADLYQGTVLKDKTSLMFKNLTITADFAEGEMTEDGLVKKEGSSLSLKHAKITEEGTVAIGAYLTNGFPTDFLLSGTSNDAKNSINYYQSVRMTSETTGKVMICLSIPTGDYMLIEEK